MEWRTAISDFIVRNKTLLKRFKVKGEYPTIRKVALKGRALIVCEAHVDKLDGGRPIRIWDLGQKMNTKLLNDPRSRMPICSIECSPEHQVIAAGYQEGLMMWDFAVKDEQLPEVLIDNYDLEPIILKVEKRDPAATDCLVQ